jgi:hypothetical protein
LIVCQLIRQRQGIFGFSQHKIRVASIDIEASELGIRAQVFFTALAKFADAASPVQPGDTNPLDRFETGDTFPQTSHATHDLVPNRQRQVGRVNIAFDGVQIGVADTAHLDLDQNLPRAWFWCGKIGQFQGKIFSCGLLE